jgi:hypothetical protein
LAYATPTPEQLPDITGIHVSVAVVYDMSEALKLADA